MSGFGHHAIPLMDFCIELDAIASLAGARGPIPEDLPKRVAAAMEFDPGDDALAVVAKEHLRLIANGLRKELGVAPAALPAAREPGAGRVTVTAPNGAVYHLTLEGDDLWVHLEAAPGQSARIDYEANAGNEGWLRGRQRPAMRSAIPLRRARVAE